MTDPSLLTNTTFSILQFAKVRCQTVLRHISTANLFHPKAKLVLYYAFLYHTATFSSTSKTSVIPARGESGNL